jgi:hypothetical protein
MTWTRTVNGSHSSLISTGHPEHLLTLNSMARRRTILKRKPSSLPQELADPKRPRLGPSDPQTPMQPGLPSLPPELLLHITGQLAEDIDDGTLRANPQPVNLHHSRLARSTTLRALSQTCASLRQMCLTLAWRRVYACTTTGEGAWYQQVARVLHAKSHGLMSHAYLAIHVQFVNLHLSVRHITELTVLSFRVLTVALTRTEAKKVLPAFVSCLSFLPKLHTLELVHVHSEMTTALSNAFEGHTFPQIRRVFLPSCAHQLLRACTHVREVLCNEDDGSKLITAIAKACKHVEHVHNIAGIHGYLKRKCLRGVSS